MTSMVKATRKSTGPLLQKLRALMKQSPFSDPLQAYIVPHIDPHNSEYLAPSYERRAFLSGFTGSAGTAVVTQTKACLWTDGRYFLQASDELDNNWTLMKEGVPGTPKLEGWLLKELPQGSRVGVDPTLVSQTSWRTWSTELAKRQHKLVPVVTNLVDELWDDKPPPPDAPLITHPVRYSGKSSQAKVADIRKKMEDKNASILVVSALDEVAWLLNLRGSEIPYNPVFFAYVVINSTDVTVFINPDKITPAIHSHFADEGLKVTIQPYETIVTYLKAIKDKKGASGEQYWIPHTTNYAIVSVFPESSRINDVSPIAEMKALKNPVEIQGLKDCHVRDGAALVCYLAWLESQLAKGANVTEISGATKLEEFRREQQDFVGLSFPTISCSGSNAAMAHYQASPETDRQITTDLMYLCDSGAQYKDGTTDITRTVHFGTPTEFQKECFTRVFKGHVALATVNFPATGIKGNCLDTLARHSLWQVGLNYNHGTGHGIGSYLNVHEGPMGISWRAYPDDPGLQEGMFLSNEPGYYEDGEFGIRIENIQRIIPAKTKYQKSDSYLTFEVVSLAPIQVKLLQPELLTKEEIDWLNHYHSEVREKLTPLLLKQGHSEAAEWLRRETEPLG